MLKTSTTSADLRASLVTNERVRCQNVPIKMTSIRATKFEPITASQSIQDVVELSSVTFLDFGFRFRPFCC